MSRVGRAITARWPEILILLVGAALRLSMRWNFDHIWGYDFGDHLKYIRWLTDHRTLPRADYSRATYHPPVYYYLAAQALRHGVAVASLCWISIASGIARLVLLWIGLERLLPSRRGARLFALALAAVLPCSVHLDGMTTGEALLGLLSLVAMLLAMPLLARAPISGSDTGVDIKARQKMLLGTLLGVVLATAVLTKISALVVAASLAGGATLQLILDGTRLPNGRSGRLVRLAPWLLAFALLGAGTRWYFQFNQQREHKYVLNGLEHGPLWAAVTPKQKTPYWQRRDATFFRGWTSEIFQTPYFSTGTLPRPMFWPQLVATTFVDYFNYRFSHAPVPGEPFDTVRAGLLPRHVLDFARWSVRGGTVLALATVAAWLAVVPWLLRRRDVARLTLIMIPFAALLGQLHYSIELPVDDQGMIKGTYMQFAAPPLCALAGVAFSWCWQRWWTRPVAALLLASIASVAAYSIRCRLF